MEPQHLRWRWTFEAVASICSVKSSFEAFESLPRLSVDRNTGALADIPEPARLENRRRVGAAWNRLKAIISFRGRSGLG
jgi:hypothetical protein